MDKFLTSCQRARSESGDSDQSEAQPADMDVSRSSSVMTMSSAASDRLFDYPQPRPISQASFVTSTPTPSGSGVIRQSRLMDEVYDSQSLQEYDSVSEPEPEAGASQSSQSEGEARTKEFLRSIQWFYKFGTYLSTKVSHGKQVHSGEAICKRCAGSVKIKFQTDTYRNLKSHYEKKHGKDKKTLTDLNTAIERGNKRGRKPTGLQGQETTKLQLSMEETFQMKHRFSQERCSKAWTMMFVDAMMPLSLTDNKSVREMAKTLQPEFKPPTRKTLRSNVTSLAAKARTELRNLLAELDYVATTADSWSAHNRAFLGATVHWIDPKDLTRKSATLACCELKAKQTKELLATTLDGINQDFDISRKIVATTTDNGANYVGAFSLYGAKELQEGDVPVEAEEEVDFDVGGVAIHNIDDALEGEDDDEEGDLPKLPKHFRCIAHTLNLLATADVDKVRGWNFGEGGRAAFRKTSGRAQAIWNLQNRSTVAANSIKAALGKKLKTPCATRWNSFYDSAKQLLENCLGDNVKRQVINDILRNDEAASRGRRGGRHVYAPFDDHDKEVLAEYVQVMGPVADCLDRLQAEDSAYMGVLLPTLYVLKMSLEQLAQDQQLVYAQPLVAALQDQRGITHGPGRQTRHGFNNRCEHLFSRDDLLVATTLHPHYGPSTLRVFADDEAENIKKRIVKELVNMIRPDSDAATEQPEEPGASATKAIGPHKKYFAALFGKVPAVDVRQEGSLEHRLNKAYDSWQRSEDEEPQVKREQFPEINRDSWIKLFIKYNTAIPSSAAAERLFSIAGDVLRPKRAAMTSDNFENQVFLKGNMFLLR